jgi:hypothetical protein
MKPSHAGSLVSRPRHFWVGGNQRIEDITNDARLLGKYERVLQNRVFFLRICGNRPQ